MHQVYQGSIGLFALSVMGAASFPVSDAAWHFAKSVAVPQVYQGGIGSYALLVMVAAFLLLHPSRRTTGNLGKERPPLEGNLGVLLLDFLRLYGRSLNVNEVGVSCQYALC